MQWRTSTVAKSANCIRINQATIAVKLCKTSALHSHRNVSNAAWNNKCAESPGAASNLKRFFNKREESIFGPSASFWPFCSSAEWVISKPHSDTGLVNAAVPKPIQATKKNWQKTTEHVKILGQEATNCSSPQGGKRLIFTFSRQTREQKTRHESACQSRLQMEEKNDCCSLFVQPKIRTCFPVYSDVVSPLYSPHWFPLSEAERQRSCRHCCCCCSRQGFVPSEAHLIRLITLGVHNSFKFIVLPLGCLCVWACMCWQSLSLPR